MNLSLVKRNIVDYSLDNLLGQWLVVGGLYLKEEGKLFSSDMRSKQGAKCV